jgi:hypothetical protein
MEKNPTLKQLVLAQKALLAFEKAADAAPPASPARRDVSLLRETMESAVLRQVFGMLESDENSPVNRVLYATFDETRARRQVEEPLILLEQLGEDFQSSPALEIPRGLWRLYESWLNLHQRRGNDDESKLQSLQKQREHLCRRLLRAARICFKVRRRLGEPVSEAERQLVLDVEQELTEPDEPGAGESPSGDSR